METRFDIGDAWPRFYARCCAFESELQKDPQTEMDKTHPADRLPRTVPLPRTAASAARWMISAIASDSPSIFAVLPIGLASNSTPKAAQAATYVPASVGWLPSRSCRTISG